jgi:hypothetical protein
MAGSTVMAASHTIVDRIGDTLRAETIHRSITKHVDASRDGKVGRSTFAVAPILSFGDLRPGMTARRRYEPDLTATAVMPLGGSDADWCNTAEGASPLVSKGANIGPGIAISLSCNSENAPSRSACSLQNKYAHPGNMNV